MLNPVDTALAAQLRHELPAVAFPEPAPEHTQEPRGRFEGVLGLLVAPGTTEEVATVLRLAHAARVPVIPYGGGTGLVGGQIAPDLPAPLLLSLQRMTAIRAVYPTENVLIAEAGTILADVQTAAEKVDRLFPLSLASEGSARIGGLLATNAGGVNVLRYGNARNLCLGLEVVMADGTIWNGLSRLRKDNTGYDIRNLVIGSEGTLGVITAAALRLSARPAGHAVGLFAVPDPEAALELLAVAGRIAGDTVSAFELIHRVSFGFLGETMPDVRLPFETPPEWCVLIDLAGASGFEGAGALLSLFEAGMADNIVLDGWLAQSDAQAAAFWKIRESIPEANRRIGSVSSHDISVPLSAIPEFIRRGGPALRALGPFRINCFGHVGDGNLHYNVFPPLGESREAYTSLRTDIKRTVHDLVDELGGSVSAEHGIGRLKVDDLERYGDPVKLAAMRAIKSALDPQGILNPGAVLRRA